MKIDPNGVYALERENEIEVHASDTTIRTVTTADRDWVSVRRAVLELKRAAHATVEGTPRW